MIVVVFIVLKMKGELSGEIVGVVSVMVVNVLFFFMLEYDFVDIVGIGGDGYNMINIFSVVGVVVVFCGVKVVKYGNRSVLSKLGLVDFFK